MTEIFLLLLYNFPEGSFHGHAPLQTQIVFRHRNADCIKNVAALLGVGLTDLCDRAAESQIRKSIRDESYSLSFADFHHFKFCHICSFNDPGIKVGDADHECFNRYLEATLNRSMRSEDVWALRQQWDRAVVEMREALSNTYTAYQSMMTAREELNRAYQQLAPTLRDMQAFTAGTDANKVVESYNYFVRWNELFTKEFN